jgi:hypothetical protein
MKTKHIILNASINNMGHLLVTHKPTNTDLHFYGDSVIDNFKNRYIHKKHYKDLDNGWKVNFKMAVEFWDFLTSDEENDL